MESFDVPYDINLYDPKEKKEDLFLFYKNIYQQIIEYYSFHKKIETFFSKGYNDIGTGLKEDFYFINSSWIKKWKLYSNYDEVIKYIDNSDIDFLINKNILKENNEYYPSFIKFNGAFNEFPQTNLLEAKDFENLVNCSLKSSIN